MSTRPSLIEQAFLSGTFTGTVESDSDIELGDLSSISFTFTITQTAEPNLLGSSTGNAATFFSFNVDPGNASSFDFEGFFNTGTDSGIPICVGAAAVFGLCGRPDDPVDNIGILEILADTSEFPTITLVSSVTTTPLPSTWTTLIAGFVGLSFFAYLGTKKNGAGLAAA
jgi:hypothetical protein